MELLVGVVVVVLVGVAFLAWLRGTRRGRARVPEVAHDQDPGQDRPRSQTWDPRERYDDGPPPGRSQP